MDTDLEHALSNLPKGSILQVPHARGKSVAIVLGLVWITQDGDPRDVFLQAGQSFVFDRPGLALVQALKPSRLAVLGEHAPVETSHPERRR